MNFCRLPLWITAPLVRGPILFLPLFLSMMTSAAQLSANEQWASFLKKPSASTYDPLSRTIQACVVAKCRDGAVLGSEYNFAPFYQLLRLARGGNHFAMDIAFQMRPLYKNVIAPSEDLEKSLGSSSTFEPKFFLQLTRKYNLSPGILERLITQTSTESIDDSPAQREELRRRIQSLSKVNDPTLLPLRDKAISFIQREIDQYSSRPDNALGK